MLEITSIHALPDLPHPIASMLRECIDRLQREHGDLQELCWFLIVEPGDTLTDLHRIVDPQLWEWRDEYPDHLELYYVQSDSGYGPVVIVPLQGTHPEILELLRS